MKKATKLLENDISSQGDDNDEDDDMTEDDIYRLHEELENVRLQNNEMKAALNEARTIIDQQQNQLTEFRRCAAQYQTDTEAFKMVCTAAEMKSMFLLSNTQTRDEQVATLIGACERLEAEIEALTWQLDQAKQSLDLKTQECDFLNEQLDEIQLTGGSGSNNNHHNNDDSSINNNMNKQNHVNGENGDKKKTETDQLRSTLSTDYRSFIGNSQVAQMNTLSTGSNMNGANDLNVQVELQKLQEEVIVYQKKEKEWEKVREELLKRQKSLEEEKKQQDLVIGRLASEQATKIQEESLENGDDNEMPAEIVATLNNLHEERTTWKLYASSLVRSFVENCEEFIRKTPYNEPYFESDGERRWYTYSMYLLENLLNVAPYLLSRSDLDLLKRTSNPRSTQRMNRYNTGYSTVERSYEPQLLTALDFPLSASQTQINNSNAGQLPTSEFVQVPLTQQTRSLQQHFGQEPQLFSQVPNSATTVAQNLTQKNMSQRAARAATKPIADLYRKKRQK
ncbi:unnamed protein product [Heterobilharzia americana]|nr:unnamed protein product [Heterobilharzia americana]